LNISSEKLNSKIQRPSTAHAFNSQKTMQPEQPRVSLGGSRPSYMEPTLSSKIN